jgi:hypothetical protein
MGKMKLPKRIAHHANLQFSGYRQLRRINFYKRLPSERWTTLYTWYVMFAAYIWPKTDQIPHFSPRNFGLATFRYLMYSNLTKPHYSSCFWRILLTPCCVVRSFLFHSKSDNNSITFSVALAPTWGVRTDAGTRLKVWSWVQQTLIRKT